MNSINFDVFSDFAAIFEAVAVLLPVFGLLMVGATLLFPRLAYLRISLLPSRSMFAASRPFPVAAL